MQIKHSFDWAKVGTELRSSMQQAPVHCRKDLARMIGNIEGFAQMLSREEVELRRTKKTTSPYYEQVLTNINESITEFEKWLMLAYLQHG